MYRLVNNASLNISGLYRMDQSPLSQKLLLNFGVFCLMKAGNFNQRVLFFMINSMTTFAFKGASQSDPETTLRREEIRI